MANKPLKSIKFPGLSDTYTVPEVDSTLTGSGKTADAKAVGDQLGDLKSAVMQVANEKYVDRSTIGTAYIDFNFEIGKKYTFENLYSGSVVAVTVNEKNTSATAIDTFTSGCTGYGIFCIEPTANATVLRVYFSDANGKAKVSEIGTPIYDVGEALPDVSEIINKKSLSIDNSVSVFYYPTKAGVKYKITNTGTLALTLNTKSSPKAENIENIVTSLAAGSIAYFTPSNNTNYIRADISGSGTKAFTIESTATEVNELWGSISSLQTTASELTEKVNEYKHEAIIESASSGYIYIDYHFEEGKAYLFENLYDGVALANTTTEKTPTATTINTFTGGATGKSSFCMIATEDASVLRVYFQNTNGKARVSEIGTGDNRIDDIYRSYPKVTRFCQCTFHNGVSSIYYPVTAGKSYKIKNITQEGSGNLAIQVYTRDIPLGSNIDTFTSGLLPGGTIIATATTDADYLRLQSAGEADLTFTIDEVGTVTEEFDNGTYKKPYQSGQIHFTVPVNQQRLYFTQGSENTTQDNETNIVNVNCVLMLPPTYTPIGNKTNLLMIVHGSGGGVTETTWFRDEATVLAFFQRFLDAGFAIFDCNGYKNGSEGQESWGVDTASIAYHKAYEYVIKNYNVTEEMCVYGFSMGGLNALNYCNMFPGGIKALGLGSPVVSLYNTIWVDTSVQAKGDVSRAYGFAVSGTYEADTVGNCDPYTRIKTIDDVDYYLQRLPTVKIWHGDSDTAVYYQYSQRLYNAIKNSGGFAYYRIVTGKGHEICYGGNANVINEIIMYFKRFVLT